MKIIAELCQNHNGSIDAVYEMVDECAEAGATHVKIQHILARNITFRQQFEEGGIDPISGIEYIKRPYKDEYNRLTNLELSNDEVKGFINYCNLRGVIPLTTCFCTEHVSHLSKIGFKEIKVASYDCGSHAMIKVLKDKFDHIYISTGASFDKEISKTANILEKEKLSFLHCVTRYPTPLDALNIGRISWLKLFNKPVGFSDHSLKAKDGISALKIAIAAGAELIEAHYRIFPPDESKDGPVSINKDQLKEIREFSTFSKEKQLEILRNENLETYLQSKNNEFVMSDEEYKNRLYFRGRFASLVEKNGIKHHVYNWEEYI
tara:strand:+ start:32255 stop:33214 length:960 start_codon:yes stop_codon:yes gene_type:complete